MSPAGEVLSIARYTGKKAKEVRARLGEPEGLPSTDEAKASAARSMSAAMTRHIAEAKAKHREAMAPLETKRQAMTAVHRAERQKLQAAQQRRWEAETRARSERLNKGLRGLWDRLTGHHARTQRQNLAEAHAALKRDQGQRQALIQAQLSERRQLQAKIKSARREHAALLRELRAERQHYRHKPEYEVRKTPPSQTSPRSRLAQSFENAAKTEPRHPNPQDRLERLRSRQQGRQERGDREPDIER